MIANADAAVLLGKNVKMRNSELQMWSKLVGLRVAYGSNDQELFLADFSNGYAANLSDVLELVEQEPPALEPEDSANPGPASEQP